MRVARSGECAIKDFAVHADLASLAGASAHFDPGKLELVGFVGAGHAEGVQAQRFLSRRR